MASDLEINLRPSDPSPISRSMESSDDGTDTPVLSNPISTPDTCLTSSPGVMEPRTTYHIVKSAHLPTLTVSLAIIPTGGTAAATSPPFHTSTLSLLLHKPLLPPAFRIYSGNPSLERAPEEQPGTLVASLSYPGLCGVKGMTCRGEILAPAQEMLIERVGWGREYIVSFRGGANLFHGRQLVWKGTSQVTVPVALTPTTPAPTPNPAVLDLRRDGRSAQAKKLANGNLKLCPADDAGEVLAVWENLTDWSVLGRLKIYADLEAGGGLEEVVCSCLGVVAAERVSYRGWVGGMLKS